MTLDATHAFYPDKKETELLPSKNYARIFGKDGFMEIDGQKSSPESSLEGYPGFDIKPTIPPEEMIQNGHSVATECLPDNLSQSDETILADSKIALENEIQAKKRKLKKELIEEYETRLKVFREYISF